MLHNCFVILLSVYVVEMPSEIRVSGFWPVDKIGYTTGERGFIRAIFLTAYRKKAE